MRVNAADLQVGDRVISVHYGEKWDVRGTSPNMVGAVVTKVVKEFIGHIPLIEFQGVHTKDSIMGFPYLEIERDMHV